MLLPFTSASAFFVVFTACLRIYTAGSELGNRESHFLEQAARIVCHLKHALLLRHTILNRVYKILGRTLNSYHREKSEGYCQYVCISVINQIVRKVSAHAIGYLIYCTATAALAHFMRLCDLCVEDNRINYLNHSYGK